MSINAIGGISLYEYYYQINKPKEEKKKSPLADEMAKYGLTPTKDESLNAILLNQAKRLSEKQSKEEENPESYSERPWADLMYQLNLEFNPNPDDDIDEIKEKLDELLMEADDEELNREINDLKSYVESLFIGYSQNHLSTDFNYDPLGSQLTGMSMINRINLP